MKIKKKRKSRRMKGRIEQRKNEQQGQRNKQKKPLRSGGEVLELTTPFDQPPGGQVDLLLHALTCLRDGRCQVATSNVELDRDLALDVFATDLGRAGLHVDAGHLLEGDPRNRAVALGWQ